MFNDEFNTLNGFKRRIQGVTNKVVYVNKKVTDDKRYPDFGELCKMRNIVIEQNKRNP